MSNNEIEKYKQEIRDLKMYIYSLREKHMWELETIQDFNIFEFIRWSLKQDRNISIFEKYDEIYKKIEL